MEGYSNDLNIYMKQVNKIISEYYYKTIEAQKNIAEAVNSGDFNKAINLTLSSTQLSNITSQNKIFVGHFTGDARDMGVVLCGELIKIGIVNKAVELFSESYIAEALMNAPHDEIAELSDDYNDSPFEEYHVHQDVSDEDLLTGCIIEYTHKDKEPTRIDMHFDKYALNEWLDANVLVVDGMLCFNFDPMGSTSLQVL